MAPFLHPQLPLGFEPGELFTFDSYVPGSNTVMTSLAQQMAGGEDEQQLYIWGQHGMGKSHLLQASCHIAAKNHLTVCYLTKSELENQSADIFDGLEQVELICLDDVELWLTDSVWEEALFDLINRLRETRHRLIMASTSPPDDGFITLPDLLSRLQWGPVFQIQPLSDDEKYMALRFRARQNGLELPKNVADYLMQRYPRDMFGLFERLAMLDKASMAMQRRLTIPLIKSVFDRG